MVQKIDNIFEHLTYTIYYANNDKSSLESLVGSPEYIDENTVIFNAHENNLGKVQKIRYNTNKDSLLLKIRNENDKKFTKTINVYDCIPWESTYEIQGYVKQWGSTVGHLKLFVPNEVFGIVSDVVSSKCDRDVFTITFEDSTEVEFEAIYDKFEESGNLIFNGDKSVLDNGHTEISSNISVYGLDYSERDWVRDVIPFSEDIQGFKIQIDDEKEFKNISDKCIES